MKQENFERATKIKELIKAAKENVNSIRDMQTDAPKSKVMLCCNGWKSIDFYNDFYD